MKGSIVQRGEKSFAVVIYKGRNPITGKKEQKWHSVKGDQDKAEAELHRILHEMNIGAYIDPSAITVSEYLNSWLTDYAEANVSGKTLERYRSIVNHHLVPAFGRLPVQKLAPAHIQSYYAKARKDGRKDGRKGGLSAQTILHHHRLLAEALKQAVQLQILVRNPTDAVKPPRVPDREVKVLNPAETSWLLELAEGTRVYLPILLAVSAGLRRGEILGLKWSDLDWDRGVLRIERAVEETKDAVSIKPPKSKRGRRSVTLPSLAIDALRQHKAKQEEYQQKLGPDYMNNGLVCCVEDGSLWTPSAFTSTYRALLKRRNLSGPNFHALRHSHASQLISQGTDVATVSARLGHSRKGFTLDTYTHLLPGQDEQAAQRLDLSLRSAREKLHARTV